MGRTRTPTPGALTPERVYTVESQWREERFVFELVFTRSLLAAIDAAGGRIDVVTGMVELRGERRHLLAAGAEFERQTGERAPAWLFRWPSRTRPFVLARGRMVVDIDDDSGAVALTLPRACVPIITCLQAPYLPAQPVYTEDAFAPLAASDWRPLRARMANGVVILADSRKTIERAAIAFDEVCGQLALRFSKERASHESLIRRMFALEGDLLGSLGSGRAIRAQIAEAAQLLAVPSSQRPAVADLVQRLRAQRQRLAERLMPVEIVVVPAGKHFSALPQMAGMRRQAAACPTVSDDDGVVMSSAMPLHSANVILRGRRYLFLPDEDLRAHQISSRHELYHLLEAQLMTDSERDTVSAAHAATVARAGPFVRPYGFLRVEYLPTMGEVYEGAYGRQGMAWLEERHPELLAFFEGICGRRAPAVALTRRSRYRRP